MYACMPVYISTYISREGDKREGRKNEGTEWGNARALCLSHYTVLRQIYQKSSNAENRTRGNCVRERSNVGGAAAVEGAAGMGADGGKMREAGREG